MQRFKVSCSILRNIPPELLGEIVLIDDCSPIQLNATFLRIEKESLRRGISVARSWLGSSTFSLWTAIVR